MGFGIEPININTSGVVWEISDDGKTMIQPFTSIKGLGEKAIEQILDHRPFSKVDDLLFKEGIVHSKLNKKALDVLCRSGALSTLMDDRFSGMKHLWSAAIADRPKNLKKLNENIEMYKKEGEFSIEEKINYLSELTGSTSIKCWGINKRDKVLLNRPYMAKLDYNEQWGFSTRSIYHNLRLIG